jgi:hypothetical protein
MEVPGVGVLTATALLASLNNASHFDSGRHFAANIGLVPHEHSTGGRQRLFGISKRGDGYLRMLLIHGARSALQWAHKRTDRILLWAADLQQREGTNGGCRRVGEQACPNRLGITRTWSPISVGAYLKHGDALSFTARTFCQGCEGTRERCTTGKTGVGIIRLAYWHSKPISYLELDARTALWLEHLGAHSKAG